MKKQLRFDLYKILKSPIMWAIFGASLILLTYVPCSEYFAQYRLALSDSQYEIGPMMQTMGSRDVYPYITVCIIFFVAFFVGKDYATGYYKNIGYGINKTYYVLSKAIYIVAFAVLWFLLYFLMNVIVCSAFGGSINYKPGEFCLSMSLMVLSVIAFGLVVMALVFATKNRIPALIVPIIFLFAWKFVETALDDWLAQTFPKQMAQISSIPFKQCIFERFSIMNYYSFYNGVGNVFWYVSDTVAAYGTLLVYCSLAIGVGLMFCYLRKRKI